MGVFDGIEHVSAEGTSLRRYFEPGNFVVSIQSIYLFEKRLGGGKLFIIEAIVEESDNLNIACGEQRNWVQSLALPSALPRIKSFIGAAMGLCPKRQLKDINEQVTAEVCNQAISQDNPLRGKKLKLNCISKITRSGKEFTQHNWGIYETR